MWLVGSQTNQNAKKEAHANAYSAMPQLERSFVDAVQKARKAYRDASNDMAKGATRPARAADVCSLMKSTKVIDWAGVVSKLSSNNDGKGVLGVSVGEDVYLSTWNNSISDSGDHTLIEPNSILFKQASALSEGKLVKFSGNFLPSDVDCLREISITFNCLCRREADAPRGGQVHARGLRPEHVRGNRSRDRIRRSRANAAQFPSYLQCHAPSPSQRSASAGDHLTVR